MQKKMYAKKLDAIALSAAIFMLLLIFFNNIFKNIILSVFTAGLALTALHICYNMLTKKRRLKSYVKKSDAQRQGRIFYNLNLQPTQKLNGFFEKLLSGAGYVCVISDNQLTATKNEISYSIFYHFENIIADSNTVYKCERSKNASGTDAFILFCCEYNAGAREALTSVNQGTSHSTIHCKNSLFKEMQKQDLYPEIVYQCLEKKKTFKEILNYSFNRARFKSYFMLAVIMYLFSYVSPFKTYYLLFSSALFAFAAFCVLNKKYNREHVQTYKDL